MHPTNVGTVVAGQRVIDSQVIMSLEFRDNFVTISFHFFSVVSLFLFRFIPRSTKWVQMGAFEAAKKGVTGTPGNGVPVTPPWGAPWRPFCAPGGPFWAPFGFLLALLCAWRASFRPPEEDSPRLSPPLARRWQPRLCPLALPQ